MSWTTDNESGTRERAQRQRQSGQVVTQTGLRGKAEGWVAERKLLLMVIVVTVTVIGAMLPAIARAGDAGGDLEGRRARVIQKIDGKIGAINARASELRAEEVPGVDVVANGAVAELEALRVAAAAASTVQELEGTMGQAGSVYRGVMAGFEAAIMPAMTPGERAAAELANAKRKATKTAMYKIGLLEGWLIENTGAPGSDAVQAGIGELRALLGAIEASSDVEQIYQYKEQAHSIYGEAMVVVRESVEDSEDPGDKGEARETEREKEQAKEAHERAKDRRELAASRARISEKIGHKASLLNAAGESTTRDDVAAIYTAGAVELMQLVDAAGDAPGDDLEELWKTARRIYHETRQQVAELLGGDTEDPGSEDGLDEAALEELTDEDVAELTEAINHQLEKLAIRLDSLLAILTGDAAVEVGIGDGQADKVGEAVDAVNDVVDSLTQELEGENPFDTQWSALETAMRDLRKAIMGYYISVDAPGFRFGIHIPG